MGVRCRLMRRRGTPTLRHAGPGARAHGCVRLEGVADPSRGTRVAIGIPLVAAVATALWDARAGAPLDTTASDRRLPARRGCSGRADRRPARPTELVHGLDARRRARRAPRRPAPRCRRRRLDAGDPTRSGMAPTLRRREGSRRCRASRPGSSALRLLAGGSDRRPPRRPRRMLAAVAVNSERPLADHARTAPRPLLALWRRGLRVDLLETVLVVPLLSVLLIADGAERGPRRHDDGVASRRPSARPAQPGDDRSRARRRAGECAA